MRWPALIASNARLSKMPGKPALDGTGLPIHSKKEHTTLSERKKALLKYLGLLACLWLAARLSPEHFTVLMYAVVTLTCLAGIVYGVANRKRILTFINHWPTSFFCSVVIFFICKLSAEKQINAQLGIEAEYIRQSASVGGVLLAIPLSLMLIGLYLLITSAYRKVVQPVSRAKPAPTEQGQTPPESLAQLRPFFAIAVLTSSLFLLTQSDNSVRYWVLVDAMLYSDCGPPEKPWGYVRKNLDSCYRVDTRLFHGAELIAFASRKPG